MGELLSLLCCFFKATLSGRCNLALENLALRQQLAILKRTEKRPAISTKDRLFWVWLSRIWSEWRAHLLIVKPDTVIGWHRKGFRLFWTRLSRRKIGGRPSANSQIRALIKQMTQANTLCGAPRIHGELLKLGIDISERSVSRLMPKVRKPPSQTWRTFLNNHIREMVSIDFLTVPTATFRMLYVFVVLAHDRRRVVHLSVTEHPTAAWTAQQIIDAFPEETAPRFLLRDRDQIYGEEFRTRVAGMRIEEAMTAPHSPWQSPYVERLIGSIRRECLNYVIVFNETHLRRILKSYIEYYNSS
jgi:putative transposase